MSDKKPKHAKKIFASPSDIKEHWPEALKQFKSAIKHLSEEEARPIVEKFASAAIMGGCNEDQLRDGLTVARKKHMGDVFVCARQDAEDAAEGSQQQ
ncbi:hypothetical protein TruAng_000378 [Truncatella angustata]|nr:hypothetical protein TruAng_000378 [Truncatella angustata]